MFRILEREVMLDDIHYISAACLSTDSKPVGWATGSSCLEVDTGKVFFYDEEGGEWIDPDAGGDDNA